MLSGSRPVIISLKTWVVDRLEATLVELKTPASLGEQIARRTWQHHCDAGDSRSRGPRLRKSKSHSSPPGKFSASQRQGLGPTLR